MFFFQPGGSDEADEGGAAEEENGGGKEDPWDCSAQEGAATPRGQILWAYDGFTP